MLCSQFNTSGSMSAGTKTLLQSLREVVAEMRAANKRGDAEMDAVPRWVQASKGDVPNGAVVLGKVDGEDSYVARVKYEGKWIPGQLTPSVKKCTFICDEDVFKRSNYEILCNCTAKWTLMTEDSEIPKRALHLDRNEPHGSQTFIGRKAEGKNNMLLGVVNERTQKVCVALDDDMVKRYSNFEILVVPVEEMDALDQQDSCEQPPRDLKPITKEKSPKAKREEDSSSSSEQVSDRSCDESESRKHKKKGRDYEECKQKNHTKGYKNTDKSNKKYSRDGKKKYEIVRPNKKYDSSEDDENGDRGRRNTSGRAKYDSDDDVKSRRHTSGRAKYNSDDDDTSRRHTSGRAKYDSDDDDKSRRNTSGRAKYDSDDEGDRRRGGRKPRRANHSSDSESDSRGSGRYRARASYDSDEGQARGKAGRARAVYDSDDNSPRGGRRGSGGRYNSGTRRGAAKQGWVSAQGGDVPRNAVVGGRNHHGDVFVARAEHKGALLPGKLIPKYGLCYVSKNGEEIRKRKYEVLCDLDDEDWVEMDKNDPLPAGAFRGGYNEDKDDLYIGRVKTGPVYTVGRVEEVRGKYYCFILLQQEEERRDTFEILVQENSQSRRQRQPGGSQNKPINRTKPNQQGSWEEEEDGVVPLGAVVGGNNKDGEIYVARSEHEGAILPGKLLPNHGYCYVSWKGKEYRKDKYEVLCNCDAVWQDMDVQNGDKIPKNAIPGGVSSNNEPFYIGRIRHKQSNNKTCGRVDHKTGTCTVVYGQAEHEYDEYEILVLATVGSSTGTVAKLGRKYVPKKQGHKKKPNDPTKQGLQLHILKTSDKNYTKIANLMNSTIKQHNGNTGGVFTKYNITKIEKIEHGLLKKRYEHVVERIALENANNANEKLLFHGSPHWKSVIDNGFDERTSTTAGMFGAGLYFAEHSSKSNQYIWGFSSGNKCPAHKDNSCYVCERQLVVCKVAMGKTSPQTAALKVPHAPAGHHSVTGVPGPNLMYAEYVVYRGEQALPKYVVTYKIVQ